ncbi:MAG: (Fe-S)-binding protein [Rhodospirillaceae bacterium]|nr:MAG: (Fe-S)-binding protein [Rhodospirillaceae bacterium]
MFPLADSISPDARDRIRKQAYALGFDAVGFTRLFLPARVRADLAAFLAEGRHGDMAWMESERRADPRRLWPDAASVIMLGLNYAPAEDPLASLAHPHCGTISVYARNLDYHDVIRIRLKALGRWIQTTFTTDVKMFVDTAPLLEKPLAAASHIGWQGRHTNLISRRFGSWLFLGEILTPLVLPADPPHPSHCGTCHRCHAACPTGALTVDGRIDTRRCISYLTIEYKGLVPAALRPLMGNRIYGCDDCLAVCPWNRFAMPTPVADLQPRTDRIAPELAVLAALDAAAFTEHFRGSPLQRIGRDRLVRNVLLAIGNSGRPELAAVAQARLTDVSALVRGAAVWALSRLLDPARFAALRNQCLPLEQNGTVQAEWMMEENDAPSFPQGNRAKGTTPNDTINALPHPGEGPGRSDSHYGIYSKSP